MKLKFKKSDILRKTDFKCAYCGIYVSRTRLNVDHVIPKSKFEATIMSGNQPLFLKHLRLEDVNHIDNLLPSCNSCNGMKANMSIQAFRKVFFGNKRGVFWFERQNGINETTDITPV